MNIKGKTNKQTKKNKQKNPHLKYTKSTDLWNVFMNSDYEIIAYLNCRK